MVLDNKQLDIDLRYDLNLLWLSSSLPSESSNDKMLHYTSGERKHSDHSRKQFIISKTKDQSLKVDL